MLIDHGADLTAHNKYGKTPLHLASRNKQLDVIGMLIERGADVAARDEEGSTPLHGVSPTGQWEVACMLSISKITLSFTTLLPFWLYGTYL